MTERVVVSQAELDAALADSSIAFDAGLRIAALSVVDEHGCRIWIGSSDGRYGRVWFQGALWMAHRLTYSLTYGPIPADLDLDHLCRRTLCVEPAHLEAVTHAENVVRAAQANDTCKYGHAWTTENTHIDPRGHRRCRACNRDTMRRRSARRPVTDQAEAVAK